MGARIHITGGPGDDWEGVKRLSREVADALSDAGWRFYRIDAEPIQRAITIHIAQEAPADAE